MFQNAFTGREDEVSMSTTLYTNTPTTTHIPTSFQLLGSVQSTPEDFNPIGCNRKKSMIFPLVSCCSCDNNPSCS